MTQRILAAILLAFVFIGLVAVPAQAQVPTVPRPGMVIIDVPAQSEPGQVAFKGTIQTNGGLRLIEPKVRLYKMEEGYDTYGQWVSVPAADPTKEVVACPKKGLPIGLTGAQSTEPQNCFDRMTNAWTILADASIKPGSYLVMAEAKNAILNGWQNEIYYGGSGQTADVWMSMAESENVLRDFTVEPVPFIIPGLVLVRFTVENHGWGDWYMPLRLTYSMDKPSYTKFVYKGGSASVPVNLPAGGSRTVWFFDWATTNKAGQACANVQLSHAQDDSQVYVQEKTCTPVAPPPPVYYGDVR